jgi:hypothetical protein
MIILSDPRRWWSFIDERKDSGGHVSHGGRHDRNEFVQVIDKIGSEDR